VLPYESTCSHASIITKEKKRKEKEKEKEKEIMT